jgi:hypothetical protein
MEIMTLQRVGSNLAQAIYTSHSYSVLKEKSFIRLVAMAKGNHAYPSRTRPLSPSAPMVLRPQGLGRVGRRQAGTNFIQ